MQESPRNGCPVIKDKSVSPGRIPQGPTCCRIVDGEDDPSAQTHALWVNDTSADQGSNGGVRG